MAAGPFGQMISTQEVEHRKKRRQKSRLTRAASFFLAPLSYYILPAIWHRVRREPPQQPRFSKELAKSSAHSVD